MKLQSKVLVILTGIWVLICLLFFIDSNLFLIANYKKTEQKLVSNDIARAQRAIDGSLSILKSYALSFSQWDDASQFMRSKNKAFIKSNFVPGTFTSLKINFYFYFDLNGNLYYGQAYDLNKKIVMPIPQSLLAYLNNHRYLIQNNQSTQFTGIISIPEGFVAMAALPVLTSEGTGPAAGSIFMGYYLTKEDIKAWSETVKLKVNLYPLASINEKPILSSAYRHLQQGNTNYIIPRSADAILGFTFLKDVSGKPIGLLEIETSRELFSEGLFTILHYLIIFIVLGILILITMWYLLKILVLNRILDVGKQAVAINSTGNFYKRITISGHDEINKMVSSLNSMLELIELSQEQLKYRISRRTKELEKISNLNRNLFSEISKKKSMEVKIKKDDALLKQLAYYDSLTGLPNRSFFNEMLLAALEHAKINNNKVAVLFLDIDEFKKINDTYGHETGDKVLKEVALRLKSATNNNVTARFSGDEFILYMDNITEREAVDINIAKIFDALSVMVTIGKVNINPTFSIGVSLYPDNGSSVEELINQADLAMYYAKKIHGNTYYYYDIIEKSHSSKLPY